MTQLLLKDPSIAFSFHFTLSHFTLLNFYSTDSQDTYSIRSVNLTSIQSQYHNTNMSGILNKVKDAVTGHHTDSTTDTPGSTTHRGTDGPIGSGTSTGHGPHDSSLGNKVDPRVDNSENPRLSSIASLI